MLQSAHPPPTPLSRPRPPNQRHSSALSTISIPSSDPPSAPGSVARSSNPNARFRFSHHPPAPPPPSAATPDTPGGLASVLEGGMLEMQDSPLSRAARMVSRRVPALGEELLKGAGSLVEAWTEEPASQGEMAPDAEDAGASDAGDRTELAEGEGERPTLTQEWIQHRTRDELENLLLQADRVIRERERDLGIAASIGKSLLENNVALRARQDALLLGNPKQPPPALALSNPPAGSGSASPRRAKARKRPDGCELIEGLPPPSPFKPYHQHSAATSRTHSRASSVSATHNTPAAPGHRYSSSAASISSAASLSSIASSQTPQFPRAPFSPIKQAGSSRRQTPAASTNHKRRSTTPANALSPAHAALARLEQENDELSDQLQRLEQAAAEGEEEGRKRLGRVVKELEGLRRRLREAEERNGDLEREKEEIRDEERAKDLRRKSRLGVTTFVHERESEEGNKVVSVAEVKKEKYEDLGPRAERIGRRMRRALKSMSEAPSGGGAEDEDEFDLSTSSDEEGIRAALRLPAMWPPSSSETIGGLSGTTSDGTTIDSGPTTPTVPFPADFDAEHSRSTLSALTSPSAPVPSSSPTKEESALVLSLLAQIDALRDAQAEYAEEREGLVAKLDRAREEAEGLRRELEEAEMGRLGEGKERQLGWQARKGLIGWHDDGVKGSGSGSGKKRAVGNRQMIAHRRRSSLLFDTYASSPIEASASGALTVPRVRRGGNVGGILVSRGSPLKKGTGAGARTLGSEMGSEWGTDRSATEGEEEEEEDEEEGGVGLVPFGSLLQRDSDALTTGSSRGEGEEPAMPWAEDELELLYADDAETRYELQPNSWRRLGLGPDATAGEASRAARKARRRARRLRQEATSDDDLTTTTNTGSSGGSTAIAADETSRHLVRIPRGNETEYSEGYSDDEDDESDFSDGESWEHVGDMGRKQGQRGTDYYPVSLRARHAPRMVAQRLHDRWRRWFLILIQWIQLIVVISFAVGWALSKGPKAVLDGKKRAAAKRAVPKTRRLMQ